MEDAKIIELYISRSESAIREFEIFFGGKEERDVCGTG